MDASREVGLQSTTQNQDSVELGPWPKGMNNRQAAYAIPPGQVANAVNGDFDAVGKFRRRSGYTKVTSALNSHSGFTSTQGVFFVQNGTLSLWSPTGNPTPIFSGIQGRVSYVEYSSNVFWTDGVSTGRIVAGVNHRWGVEAPAFDPIIQVSTDTSSEAGKIGEVNFYATFVRSDGVESGASNMVSIQAGQGAQFTLTNLPVTADPDVTLLRIYAGRGDVYYVEAQVSVSQTTATVAMAGNGKAAQPMVSVPPPAGSQIGYFRGRLFISVGNVLWYTNAYDVEKVDPVKNYILFENDIDLFAPTAGKIRFRMAITGIYVAAGNATIMLRGESVDEFMVETILNYGAVAGTLVQVPNTNNVMWMSTRGLILANDEGELQNLQEASIAMSNTEHTAGAAYIRESNGIRQYIGVTNTSGNNLFGRG